MKAKVRKVMERPKRLGELLIEGGVVTPEAVEEALARQRESGGRVGQHLIALGHLTEEQLCRVLGLQFGIPALFPAEALSTPPSLPPLSAKFLKERLAVPLRLEHGILTVAMADPLDWETRHALILSLGLPVETVVAGEETIRRAIAQLYEGASSMERIIEDLRPEEAELVMARDDEDVDHLREAAQEAPVVRLVNLVISRAIEMDASDVHIEPFERQLRVRYRIDGILHDAEAPPKALTAAIVSRIKIMARLNIAERRLPQDGRVKLKVNDRVVDLRVSTIPTLHGESVVLRILDRGSVFMTLDRLGFPPEPLRQFNHLILNPYGMILVTGPTGSGKTTTLYATLEKINDPEKKIITIEDPVEYQIMGVNQIQVKPAIGLSFAQGLRHIVRQDPDVIMVGEIRDPETAEIAIHAALTGHLVFSTLHTNDAAGAVTRLSEMGIESFLISSTVLGILAQRLVRVICRECREPAATDPGILKEMGVTDPGFTVWHGKGCEACNGTGYRGRTGIYELLLVDEEIRRLIVEKASAHVIRQRAVSLGMNSLRQDGWAKVAAGATTVSEVIRVTRAEEEL